MDFFEHQERARRRTGVLVFYFVLAVTGIILATYGLALAITFFVDDGGPASSPLWRPWILFYTALGTGGAIFLASAFKAAQLSGGGAVVARELGGREIDPNTTDYHERRLLNVVEEMAIASGVPVPTVYVMDSEHSINAFAAGKTTSDAVIGVTRGCMTLLTRDELQGVIAHEFSHILNGDMRLNIRLMGLLFGILFLALTGELIIRFGVRGGFESGKKEGVGAALLFLLAGLGLLAIGYVGNFFGNLIKASVSRQREYLADASAVQFTRNPDGLAGALRKIGGLSAGSKVSHPMAKDASHLFFGSAFSSQLFATHPPLQERIRRLVPSWDGSYGSVSLPPITARTDRAESSLRETPSSAAAASLLSGESGGTRLTETEAIESLRTLHPEQVELGGEMRRQLPQPWVDACRSTSGAQAVVFALLLAQDESLRTSELDRLRESSDGETFDAVSRLHAEIGSAHSSIKFGLVDLAIPTLRHLSVAEYERFRRIINDLVASDRLVDLFEFALLQVIQRHLDTAFRRSAPPRIRYRNFRRLTGDTAVLLSTFAAMSHPDDPEQVRAAFAHAAAHLEPHTGTAIPFLPAEQCGLDRIEEALDRFSQATPLAKRHLLEACSRSVLADGLVSSREAELIRATADAIGCPIPPFVRSAPLA